MPLAFTFLIFLGILTALLTYLPYFRLNDRKKKEILFSHLSREGAAHDLIFCSQEILSNGVMGVDGIHRKILLLEKQKNNYDCSMICLDEVQSCELIISGAPRAETIEVLFHFKNGAESLSLRFYDDLLSLRREVDLLEEKARYWTILFSKMLSPAVRLRA